MSHIPTCSCDVHCLRYNPFLVAEVELNDPKQSEGGNIDPAESDKASAFKQLAGFLGKENDRGQGLSMTTPVFNKTKQGVMQFYIGEGYKVRPADAELCCVYCVTLCMLHQKTQFLHIPVSASFSTLQGVIQPKTFPANFWHCWAQLGVNFVQDVSEVPAPKNSSINIRQEPGGLYGVDVFSGNAKQPRVDDREKQLRQWLKQDGTMPVSDEWVLAQYNVPWQLPGFKRNELLIPIDEKTFELW